MTTAKSILLYQNFFVRNDFERLDLFASIAERHSVRSALYPGSFAHITPSFVIPTVAYVDTDGRCPAFFTDASTLAMVEERKQYEATPVVRFHAQSYLTPLPEGNESFDLLISQWAGPISQACKRYLKRGGVLLANDSHGDATLANLDDEFQLIAVVKRQSDAYRISDRDLAGYFQPKHGVEVRRSAVVESGRGPAYSKQAAMYLFRRTT